MGDLGLFKRKPRGWTPAHAYPRHRRTYEGGNEYDRGESSGLDPSEWILYMNVTWEVHVPGWAPYVVHESGRKAPQWVRESGLPLVGKGKRYFTARLRETRGLKEEVGVPVLVDPGDPQSIWVDWDAGYDMHVPAWDRELAVERAVEERKGGIDAIAGKIFSPFRPKLAAGDEHLVDAALAAEAERDGRARREGELMIRAMNIGLRPPKAEEHARLQQHVRNVMRLHDEGRDVPATVVAITPTGEQLCRTPVYELHLDVDDGGAAVRRVVHREVMNDAWAGRMGAGTPTTVHLDPADPDRLALDRPGDALSEARGFPAIEGYVERHERLTRTGRRAPAVIVAAGPTGGTLHGLPEWAVELDVDESGVVRRIVHHEPMGRKKSPWKLGTSTFVRIDPDDPDQLTFSK